MYTINVHRIILCHRHQVFSSIASLFLSPPAQRDNLSLSEWRHTDKGMQSNDLTCTHIPNTFPSGANLVLPRNCVLLPPHKCSKKVKCYLLYTLFSSAGFLLPWFVIKVRQWPNDPPLSSYSSFSPPALRDNLTSLSHRQRNAIGWHHNEWMVESNMWHDSLHLLCALPSSVE